MLSIFLGCIVFILCLPCYCWYRCRVGKPRRSNTEFVTNSTTNNENTHIIDIKVFQSGPWDGQYFQNNKWHGPYRVDLSFDAGLRVTGSGVDDVGSYSVDGIYSTESCRIGLTKTYHLGTGNPLQNLGHNVTIQLEWNKMNNQFEGKWYVRTNKYNGENNFKLTFNYQNSVYDKV